MENEKVFAMSFSKVYGLLIAKAERKGRTRAEVEEVTFWLTGYTAQQIDELMDSEISYGDFFRQAPAMNPNREKITGVVCGVRVENVENSLMRDIRYLDKLVDELAKGNRENIEGIERFNPMGYTMEELKEPHEWYGRE